MANRLARSIAETLRPADMNKGLSAPPTSRPTGALQFDVGMKAGPTTLTSIVDITTWTENSTIGWHSRDGFNQIGKWAFTPNGDATRVTFDMEYEFGGGIAGKLLGRAAEPIVRGNLQRSVETLKQHTERLTGPRSTARQAPKSTTKAATKRAVPPRSRARNT